jgi:hypothetical protein
MSVELAKPDCEGAHTASQNFVHAKVVKCFPVTFTVLHDGVDALKSHFIKKSGHRVQPVASSRRMHTFCGVAGTPQSDEVTLDEQTHVYKGPNGVKHHSSYLQQDCAVKVRKTVVDDSDLI